VQRVRIADTLGLLDPAATTRLFTSLCGHFPISFGFHGHNDFGMATANALAAAAAGAQCVDVSLMGLGERAGIAATEEVVGWQTLQERHSQIQLSPIIETAKSLARQLGLAIAPRKPMLGSALFRCESGMHVDGIQKDPQLYEPFAPELIGARRRLDVGSKTGRSALRGVLRHLGLHVPSDLDGLVEKVRSRSRELGRPLHQGELRHMVHP
jgi:homocitrate synthase NifV